MARKLKIPKSFDIIGQTITVHRKKNIKDEEGNKLLGQACVSENKILLLDDKEVCKKRRSSGGNR